MIKDWNNEKLTVLSFTHVVTGGIIEMGGVVWKHQENHFLGLIINPRAES